MFVPGAGGGARGAAAAGGRKEEDTRYAEWTAAYATVVLATAALNAGLGAGLAWGLGALLLGLLLCLGLAVGRAAQRALGRTPEAATSRRGSFAARGPAAGPRPPEPVTEADLRRFRAALAAAAGGGGPGAAHTPWEKFYERRSATAYVAAFSRDNLADRARPMEMKAVTYYEEGEGPRRVTPEVVRDFFYDDAYRRSAWDKCLSAHARVAEWPGLAGAEGATAPGVHCGCEAVWWKRNFPAFCSDRDYVIARRTWRGEAEGEYYCVSKAASHPGAPRRGASKRVTDFSSCWRIRWADSPLHPGRRAVEVVLLHAEDMLIPKRVAAFGAKCLFGWFQKGVEPAIRGYRAYRAKHPAAAQPAPAATAAAPGPGGRLAPPGAKGRMFAGRWTDARWKTLAVAGTVVLYFAGLGPAAGLTSAVAAGSVQRAFVKRGTKAAYSL